MWGKKRLAADVEVVELLRSMHVKQGVLEGEMEKLRSGHLSLRGFVYSKLRKHDESPEDAGPAPSAAAGTTALPAQLSRDELRRKLVETGRFIPGRPPRHD